MIAIPRKNGTEREEQATIEIKEGQGKEELFKWLCGMNNEMYIIVVFLDGIGMHVTDGQ